MAVSGLGVAYSISGFVLIWSGVKNTTIQDTLTAFLKGQQPTPHATGAPTIGIADNSSGSGTGASTDGNANIPSSVGSPSAQGTYSYTQLETLWVLAGGSPSLAPTMAAIAEAESSGNVDAHNPSGASGLWQVEVPINDQYIPGGQSNVYNALDNARAAVAIEKAQGLGAWTTYTSGAYKEFLK
jgi:hypothetical protein